jgi:hypothetical protein
MEEVITTIIALGLAYLGQRWKYIRTLLKGTELAIKSPLGGFIPENIRAAAVQAVVLANQAEIERVVAIMTKRQAEDAKREPFPSLTEGMDVEIIDRTGDESWSKPFKDNAP